MANEATKSQKSVWGVGINDADYVVEPIVSGKRKICPFYTKWRSMIERCYSKKWHARQPTYINCYVCEEWKTFSNFRSWMLTQDWQGKHLDKDIIGDGVIYSPQTCIFVNQSVNNLFCLRENRRGKYPLGVNITAQGNFSASCSKGGDRYSLGTFKTPEEAWQAYICFKADYIAEIANKQKNIKLKNALLKRSDSFRNGEYHE